MGTTKMKAILLTFSATLAVVAIVATMFLNTILGAFGLAATSIDSLQNLQASQKVVERMKKRHSQKKLETTKKFAKRSTKRVTATALGAATIGTVAVAATMISFEVYDYCEEKKEMQEEENVLFGTNIDLDFNKCIEKGKEDSKSILSELKTSSVKAVSSAFSTTAQYSVEKWDAVRDASVEALQSTGAAAAGLWGSAKSWLKE